MGTYAPAYSMSKTALNAFTRQLAAATRGTGVLVNSACPGWVRTDMGGAGAPRSVQEGADTIVWLATLGVKGPTGGFLIGVGPFEVMAEAQIRFLGGLSDVDWLVEEGLRDINSESSRWSLPILFGARIRF